MHDKIAMEENIIKGMDVEEWKKGWPGGRG